MLDSSQNIIAFKHRAPSAAIHPKGLIEAIYSAGSLAIPADDVATKAAAMMLQALGLAAIEAVLADGTLRPVRRGEARQAMDRPWRLLKPAFAGQAGVPDADGAFMKRI